MPGCTNLMAVCQNIYPDGPKLCEQAKQIAQHLGLTVFKASNGWLEKWKLRHNIEQLTVSGESGEVRGATVDSWKECIPEVIEGYSAQNIWNMDETGCFWWALSDKVLGQKGKLCKGGKKSNGRMTVALFVKVARGKEIKAAVIWKSENPRCFKGVDKNSLPVDYFFQAKSWMTGEIMHNILQKVNRRLRLEGRSILLLMNNAGCHPKDLSTKFSNINVVFLSPNTTSVLQPLDLGIIQNFKIHYRKLLIQHVITRIEECSTAHEVVKSLSVLLASRWIAEAWQKVSSETIKKCFRKAGVLDSNFQVVTRGISLDEDKPFC